MIFGSGVATGKFAMGSNEPLGEQQEPDTIDLDADAPKTLVCNNTPQGPSGEKGALGKRKRGLSEDDAEFYGGLVKSIEGLSSAIKQETPGIYKALMDIPDFTKADQMFCLNFLMLQKGVAEDFMEMSKQDKEYWMRNHLALHNFGG
jgi:hypothetical protein